MIEEAKQKPEGKEAQRPNMAKSTSSRSNLLKIRSLNSCKPGSRETGLSALASEARPAKNMVCCYTLENMLHHQFYSEKDCRRLHGLLAVPTPPFSSSLLPPKIPPLNPARILSPDKLVRLEAINIEKKLYEEKRVEERKAQDLLASRQLRDILFKRDEIRAIMKKNQASQKAKFEALQAAKSAAGSEQEDQSRSPLKSTLWKEGFGHRTASLPGNHQQLFSCAKSKASRMEAPVSNYQVTDSPSADQPAVRERVQSTTSIVQRHQRLPPSRSLKSLRSAPNSRTSSTCKKNLLTSPEIKHRCKNESPHCFLKRSSKDHNTTDVTQTSCKKPKDVELIEESFDSNYIVQLRPRGFLCNPQNPV